ncbi:ABC transporter permease [Methylocella sp.]|uniref:ABC transporter permease n=1 Tax=Methylocella sp. TaxID=1978226 RepID=UPI0037843FCB
MTPTSALSALGRRTLPNRYDLLWTALIFAGFIAIGRYSRGLTLPIHDPASTVSSLDYAGLPYYAMRTTLRMFAAMAASLVFTFVYATLAAKSRRAEKVLVPLLDILQSVPILGFLSFTITFFLGLFPGSILGAECAAIFAIFTSQAWNMTFSFYQSLRNVPRDLDEVSTGFRLTPWQRFWQLEAPFAMPGLIWNMMMSMSGGWFFVVASEAISVGDTTIMLPGIGSYLALAINERSIAGVLAAVAAMAVVILLYDQLLFRPLVAFGARFRVELSAGQTESRSFARDLFLRSAWLQTGFRPIAEALRAVSFWRLDWLGGAGAPQAARSRAMSFAFDILWYGAVLAGVAWSCWLIFDFVRAEISPAEFGRALLYTLYTLARVIVLIVLATLVWVPIGVWIGLRPRVAEAVQPLAQFLAAFPANVVFPIAVICILRFHLNPEVWLSPLIILGTQWYILFNVVAGAAAFPNDLKEAVRGFRIRGFDWWFKVMIPAIFPYYVTGALTASGGSWNAAIVAEHVRWGDDVLTAQGIGSYIAIATDAGDYPRIVLGVALMSVFVILFNRMLWRPLALLAERRLRLD